MTTGDPPKTTERVSTDSRSGRSRRRSRGRSAALRGESDSGRLSWSRVRIVGRVAEVLLVSMIAFAALAFGGIEAWAQMVLALASVGLMAIVAVRCVWMRQPFVWTWLYVPMLLFVFLAVAQYSSAIPRNVVEALSPEAASLWRSAAGESGAMSLSVYPQATLDQLRLIVIACVTFVCVVNLVRSRWQAMRLLGGVTVVGLIVASLAALQDLSFATLIYWVGPPGRGLANAGPFVHYSHYGQFINLCMFAGLGWALVTLVRVQREFDLAPRDLLRAMRDERGKPVWMVLALLVLGTCTLLYSTSRTATIAFGIGLTVAVLLTSRARLLHGRAWWVTPPLVLVFGAASVLGFQVAVERLRELNSFEPYEQRKQIIADSVELWRQFPLVGTGLGTFEYVYPMVDRGTVNEVTTHAENEYVQLITETGYVGAGIVGVFMIGAGVVVVKQLRGMRSSVHMATIGIAAALLATAIHAISDFALHMPANALLVATLLGLLVALSRIDQGATVAEHSETQEESSESIAPIASLGAVVRERGPWIAWAALLVVACVLLLPSSARAWRSESLARSAYEGMLEMEKQGWKGTDVQYARVLQAMQDAQAAQPGNAVYAYRHKLFIYWAVLRERGFAGSAVELSPVEVGYLARLADEVRGVRALAPTYAPPVVLLERVLRGLGQTEEADALMDDRHKLNRADGEASRNAARLAAGKGDWEQAGRLYRRAADRYIDFREIAHDLIVTYDKPLLAREIAGSDLNRMAGLRDVFASLGKQDLADRLEHERIDAMREAALDPTVPAELFAELAKAVAQQGDTSMAVDYYRRALSRDYNNLAWRTALIDLLLNQNTPESIQAAFDEADKASRLVSADDQRLGEVLERVRKVRAATTRPSFSSARFAPAWRHNDSFATAVGG
jgi:tetratricopeptide (TPR) repeat protein